MNYAKIKWYDVANGPGVRLSLYVSGCTHKCPGCFNSEAQDFNYGSSWSKETEDKIINHLKNTQIEGISILGGEPLQQIQDDTLLNLLKRVRKETNKTIWLWTGYTFEEATKNSKRLDIIKQCDFIIDGLFVESLADPKLVYMGSKNQRLLNVKQ